MASLARRRVLGCIARVASVKGASGQDLKHALCFSPWVTPAVSWQAQRPPRHLLPSAATFTSMPSAAEENPAATAGDDTAAAPPAAAEVLAGGQEGEVPAPAAAGEATEKPPGTLPRSFLDAVCDYQKTRKFKEVISMFEDWKAETPAALEMFGPYKASVDVYNIYVICKQKMETPLVELLDIIETQTRADGLGPTLPMYHAVLHLLRAGRDQYSADDAVAHTNDILEKMSSLTKGPLNSAKQMAAEIYIAKRRRLAATTLLESIMPMRNIEPPLWKNVSITWATLLSAQLGLKTPTGALRTLKLMNDHEVPPYMPIMIRLIENPSRVERHPDVIHRIVAMVNGAARESGEKPDVIEGALLECLTLAAQVGHIELAKVSWILLKRTMSGTERKPCPASYHAAIHTRAVVGDIKGALRMLEQLECDHPDNPEAWAPLPALSFLVRKCSTSVQQVDHVYEQIQEMKADNIPISVGMLNCVLAACAQIGDLSRLFETFEVFPEFGLKPNTHSYNMLIQAANEARQFDTVSVAMDEMAKAGLPMNRQTYELLIDSKVKAHDVTGALEMLTKMERQAGFRPSMGTLNSVIKRCNRSRDGRAIHKGKLLIKRYKFSGEEERFTEPPAWRSSLVYSRGEDLEDAW